MPEKWALLVMFDSLEVMQHAAIDVFLYLYLRTNHCERGLVQTQESGRGNT